MLRPGPQRLDQCGRGWRIAERDRDVAQPSHIADAADRAASSPFQELRLAPREKLDELRVIQPVPHREVLLGGGARELIPWTNQLAVIATVDAIADCRAKLEWDRPGQLDREVGNTAPGVETIRGDDRAGGAGGHAGGAGSTVRAAGLIGGQVQVQVNFPQEKI